MTTAFRLLACAVLLPAVTAAQGGGAGNPPAIAELRRAWAQALHDKRIDDAMALYTPQAGFYNPDGSHVTGREAIRGLFVDAARTWDSTLQFGSRDSGAAGNLAYDSGDYEETLAPRDGKPASHVRGGYLMVLRRGGDGRWRIQQQVWTLQPSH